MFLNCERLRPVGRASAALLVWLTLLLPAASSARTTPDEMSFHHLDSEGSGLSFNGVHSIVQDANGFVWVGTYDGLNRYDGVEFKVYRRQDLGLQTAFVITLCADDRGDVWVGTDSGVSRYDYSTDSFKPFLLKSDRGTVIRNKVTCIRIDRSGRVWFAVNRQGLFCYDSEDGTLVNWFGEGDTSVLPAGISSFCIDNNGEFWFSLYFSGVWHSGPELSDAAPLSDCGIPEGDLISDMARNQVAGTLLVASVTKGLCEVDLKRRETRVLIPNETGFFPNAICLDGGKYAYLATSQGLWRYDFASQDVLRCEADYLNGFTLSDNKVNSVCIDRSGGLWVGTDNGGVDYMGTFQSHFKRFNSAGTLPLHGAVLRSMASDDTQTKVWIATETKGLLLFDAETNELSPYNSPSIPDELFGLCCDGKNLYLGSFLGILKLDTATGRVKRYSRLDDDAAIKDNKIYAIYKTSDGRILAGTTLGLLVYDASSDSFLPSAGLEGVFVTDIMEDGAGYIWLASYANGIYKYDPSAGKVVEHLYFDPEKESNPVPANKINSLLLDTSGNIWATAYSSGFFRLDAFGAQLFNTSTSPAIATDVNYALVEDASSHIWVSSAKGLMTYDPQTDRIITYTTHDGLLDDEFNFSSGIRLYDGSLLFGSKNGLVRFLPESLEQEPVPTRVMFTDFRVKDRIVTPASSGSVLEKNINEVTRIVLSARDNSFGLKVSMPGLSAPANGTISCRLYGLEDEWTTYSWTGRGRELYWTDVPPGRYRLSVRSVTDTHRTLQIIVRRPVLVSYGAISAYIIFITALLWAILYYLNRKNRKETEEELYREKLSFFTNIIHEIKTPLTLIRTPLQNILAVHRDDADLSEDLSLISSNADYMDKLVKEMLDFVRVEQNGYSISYRKIEIVERIRRICDSFSETARSKNISMEFSYDEERITVSADDSGLTKVLNNLLHNALKYAETYIRINASTDGENVVITVANDGPVIPKDRRSEIFKPFVQFSGETAPYSQSFGIGLSLARSIIELHGGTLALSDTDETCFICTLPVGDGCEIVPEEEEPVPASEDGGLPLVLVVEDNQDLQAYLRRKLSPEYRVAAASSAEAALKIIGKSDVDMVISDIALEGMSGIELCRAINSDFENSHIVVIMLSALSTPSVKLDAIESGAALYIEKPFDLDYLLSSVKILMAKRMAMRDAYIAHVRPDVHSFSLPGSDETFLVNLDNAIMSNLADPQFSNDQLAAALNLSRSTLIRKVKGLLGTTPNDYIRMKRLSVAANLLETNGTRISEVCYSVGFNTPSYFAKCFNARYGMLPNEYVKVHARDQKDNIKQQN